MCWHWQHHKLLWLCAGYSGISCYEPLSFFIVTWITVAYMVCYSMKCNYSSGFHRYHKLINLDKCAIDGLDNTGKYNLEYAFNNVLLIMNIKFSNQWQIFWKKKIRIEVWGWEGPELADLFILMNARQVESCKYNYFQSRRKARPKETNI